jgi:hypothetical protein
MMTALLIVERERMGGACLFVQFDLVLLVSNPDEKG